MTYGEVKPMSSSGLHRSHHAFPFPLASRGRHARTAPYVPTLAPREHVLCRAFRTDPGGALGTELALHYRPPDGAWRRVAWADVVDVGWSETTGTLLLRARPDGSTSCGHRVMANRALAAFAAERVTHAHVLRQRVELADGVFGVVEAVRASEQGDLEWRVLLDDASKRDDPALAQACRHAIALIRAVS
jgi:hypothetical protein